MCLEKRAALSSLGGRILYSPRDCNVTARERSVLAGTCSAVLQAGRPPWRWLTSLNQRLLIYKRIF